MSKKWVKHVKYKHDVYIGRPGPWGNPFKIGRDGTRLQVMQKFQEYLLGNPELLEKVKRELTGKVLGCWCEENELCHGDIYAAVANGGDMPNLLDTKVPSSNAQLDLFGGPNE